jgi:hypothetical protein
MQTSDASRRETANAHLESEQRHCERSDEAIHTFFAAFDCFAEPVIGALAHPTKERL